MLANLALYAQGGEEDRPLDSSSCDLFSNCPSLTCVSLTPGRLFSGPFTNHYPLACGQIKALDVYFTEISAALKIATLGTSIEQLALCYCNGDSSSLLLPGVTHLSVAAMEAGEAYCPFKHLTLQGLSSLEITRGPGYDDDGEDWEAWNEEPIRDFFERSGCTVTSLSLRGVPISDEQLIHLLRLMPALSSLCLEEFFGDEDVITNRTVTRQLLQKLTIDDTSSPFLPKLTDISLVLREDGLADTVLPNALISRWVPDSSQFEVACIKSVIVALANLKTESEETIEDLTLKLRFLDKRGVWVSVRRVEVVTADAAQYEAL
ncbi:hypothetical protein MPER_12652 [Moniliophthora perniciosa FA553]|nr:hypothetical protein MPER_12652 [Moniliophthora perniciosa FA553]